MAARAWWAQLGGGRVRLHCRAALCTGFFLVDGTIPNMAYSVLVARPGSRAQLASLLTASPLCPSRPAALPTRLDYLTREIHSFVRSQGVATFAQIDAHVKAQPGCVKQIAGKRGGLGVVSMGGRLVCCPSLEPQPSCCRHSTAAPPFQLTCTAVRASTSGRPGNQAAVHRTHLHLHASRFARSARFPCSQRRAAAPVALPILPAQAAQHLQDAGECAS